MRFFNDVFDDSTQQPAVTPDTPGDTSNVGDHVTYIQFHLDGFAREALQYDCFVFLTLANCFFMRR